MDTIRELELFIGFQIKRSQVLLSENRPHDEAFSYFLCQRFYGKDDELKKAINLCTAILRDSMSVQDKKKEALFYSLLGNMHYLAGDFTKSIGAFMKSLSKNRQDLTSWIELAFAIRAEGHFSLFELMIFNLERLYTAWISHPEMVLDKSVLESLLRGFDQMSAVQLK